MIRNVQTPKSRANAYPALNCMLVWKYFAGHRNVLKHIFAFCCFVCVYVHLLVGLFSLPLVCCPSAAQSFGLVFKKDENHIAYFSCQIGGLQARPPHQPGRGGAFGSRFALALSLRRNNGYICIYIYIRLYMFVLDSCVTPVVIFVIPTMFSITNYLPIPRRCRERCSAGTWTRRYDR